MKKPKRHRMKKRLIIEANAVFLKLKCPHCKREVSIELESIQNKPTQDDFQRVIVKKSKETKKELNYDLICPRPKCRKKCTSPSGFTRHMVRKHKEKPGKISQPIKQLRQSEREETHPSKFEGKKTGEPQEGLFVCEKCGSKNTQTYGNRFGNYTKCRDCGHTNGKNDEPVSIKGGDFQCEHCPRSFPTPLALNIHQGRMHKQEYAREKSAGSIGITQDTIPNFKKELEKEYDNDDGEIEGRG